MIFPKPGLALNLAKMAPKPPPKPAIVMPTPVFKGGLTIPKPPPPRIPPPPKFVPPPTTIPVVMPTGPISIFKATKDESLYYPNLPLGGDSKTIQAFAASYSLPVFQFTGLSVDKALLVFNWISIPLCVMCFGLLYLDDSLAAQDWFYIYRYVVNNMAAPGPGIAPAIGAPGPMRLIMNQNTALMPFILPAPFSKAGSWPPVNPNLTLVSGGAVPCDGSGLDLLSYFILAT
jgi:hypothetical protein